MNWVRIDPCYAAVTGYVLFIEKTEKWHFRLSSKTLDRKGLLSSLSLVGGKFEFSAWEFLSRPPKFFASNMTL